MSTRWGVLALSALLAMPAAAAAHPEHEQGRDGGQVVEGPKQVKTFNVGNAGSLKLANVSGDVRVTAGGSEIRIEATPHGRGRTDAEARAELDTVTVETRQSGNRVDVETKHKNKSRAWVDYIVTVPSGTSVDVRTVSGDVHVSEIAGASRAETVSGDVTAVNLRNVSALRTVSGDVRATDIASAGTVAFASVSGDVVLRNVKAGNATFETVSGDTRVEACDCGGASSSSVSGTVSFSGPLAKGGRYVFNAHSGDVVLTTASGFDLDAATFSGDIRVEGLTPQGGETDRHGPGRNRRGSVGGGGAVVEAKTFSGSVRIARPK
jgi:DUF4097 and DUF4098 domain-containing protein YvlB